MPRLPVQFELNGAPRAAFVEPAANLLDTLRRGIGEFAPKYGCGQGTCGACTVLIDGEPRLACLTLAAACEGARVQTASGLADGPRLHPLQEAFMRHFAAQCGFCTPGMLMAAKALLDRDTNPSREAVIDALAGNICRCTGYAPIIDAVLDAAAALRQRSA
jgi:carbon-monoxide dehydrogenase small subunit